MELIAPKIIPPLDPGFRPAALANRAFRERVRASGRTAPVTICLERPDGTRSICRTEVFETSHPASHENPIYIERIVKFLLWQKGAYRIIVAGPPEIGEHIRRTYSLDNKRAFDAGFFPQVYERPLEVVVTDQAQAPIANETSRSVGRHLNGKRVGFDAGASDYKYAAVVNGEPVWTGATSWKPRENSDPSYHFEHIVRGVREAAKHLDHLDAIGVSTAGIVVDNRVMVASLFKAVRDSGRPQPHSIYLLLKETWPIPITVCNDGEVTALAGSMLYKANRILGIAMGSSQAAGYVTADGTVTNWLNELAFAPIDYQPGAAIDPWSGDCGVGAMYFSQQAIFRLAKSLGIELPADKDDKEKLAAFQKLSKEGDPRCLPVYETVGVYLGYGLAHYADFYEIENVLLLGRVLEAGGGKIILAKAAEVLQTEFPELAKCIQLLMPDDDEAITRAQAIAAASLPEIPD